MNSKHTIIAGIDFSPASPNVLSHAVRAAGDDGDLLAVHVLNASRLHHWRKMRGDSAREEEMVQQAEAKLERLVGEHTAAGDVERRVLRGRPAAEIEALVDREQAQLLVIAANDLSKKRLGSVSSHLVRAAHCDVLVVRDWQDGNFHRVLVCVDLSTVSASLLERAIGIARADGAELEIVHVIFPPDRDLWGELIEEPGEEDGPDYVERARAKVRQDLERFLEPFATQLEGLSWKYEVLESAVPSMALTFHAEDIGADLVVLGTRGHGKLGAMFLGTNAERLLNDATVSVLAVR